MVAAAMEWTEAAMILSIRVRIIMVNHMVMTELDLVAEAGTQEAMVEAMAVAVVVHINKTLTPLGRPTSHNRLQTLTATMALEEDMEVTLPTIGVIIIPMVLTITCPEMVMMVLPCKIPTVHMPAMDMVGMAQQVTPVTSPEAELLTLETMHGEEVDHGNYIAQLNYLSFRGSICISSIGHVCILFCTPFR